MNFGSENTPKLSDPSLGIRTKLLVRIYRIRLSRPVISPIPTRARVKSRCCRVTTMTKVGLLIDAQRVRAGDVGRSATDRRHAARGHVGLSSSHRPDRVPRWPALGILLTRFRRSPQSISKRQRATLIRPSLLPDPPRLGIPRAPLSPQSGGALPFSPPGFFADDSRARPLSCCPVVYSAAINRCGRAAPQPSDEQRREARLIA